MKHFILSLVIAALAECGCSSQEPAPRPLPAAKPPEKPAGKEEPAPAPAEAPRLYELTVGETPIKVRLALTSGERFTGLQGVKSLPPDEGLLFAYKEKVVRRFWMKGCLMSLDIAFLSDDGKILSVETLDPPLPGTKDDDLKRAAAPEANRLILEMPAGWFKKNHYGPGTKVVIPKAVPLEKAE
jgi:uncharacterized membrane protein (UPF0127 family)